MVPSNHCDRNINDTLRLIFFYEGYEDYQRYVSDNRNNYEEETKVFREGEIKTT